jgi:hypothetical protein
MPPTRRALAPISSNRQPGDQLSPYQRGQILGRQSEGATPTKIAHDLNLDRSTVRYTIAVDLIRTEGKSLPRIPRGKSYTEAEQRLILRHVRLNPKDTYQEVKDACNVTCSTSTIKRILQEAGIGNWRAKRRPFLLPIHAAKRLAWCLARRNWTAEDWGQVVWSDECSVERGQGNRNDWCFRTPSQKWQKDMIQTYDAKNNMKVMVWGGFWGEGRSNLYLMDRDFESKKFGYTANSYLEVLEAELLPIFESLDSSYSFMQDNAPIHTAGKVRDFLEEHSITTLSGWPPYSPDLNPIEHIWWHLKTRVFEMFPEVAKEKSQSEHVRQRLESCLQAAWDTLDKSLFDKLYESMQSRMEACIQADGWHTKY